MNGHSSSLDFLVNGPLSFSSTLQSIETSWPLPTLFDIEATVYRVDYFCEVICDSSVNFRLSFGLLAYITSVEVTVPNYSTCIVNLTVFHGTTLGNMLTGSATTMIPSESLRIADMQVNYNPPKCW